MSLAALVLGVSARAAPPLGEAWIPADAAPELPGVGPAEGRRVDDAGAWRRVVVEPWAIAALRSATPVRGYVPDPSGLREALPAGYHGPDDVSAELDGWAARLVRGERRIAGRSVEGRPIDAVWLGQPPGSGAPAVRLLGGHHGDEAVAVEVALAVGARLVDGDGADPQVTALLDRATVWVVPLVNPDGLGAGTRENAAGVDLNRNYDWAWTAASVRPGAAPFSEPETRAVRALALVEAPGLSVSLHAGAANLGWPWNFTVEAPRDAALLAERAEAYAAGCGAPDFWVTQGAAWYVTHGDTNDWAYGRHGTLDFTLEVAADRAPGGDGREAVIAWHEQALLDLLSAAPAISGRVVDAETGEPVEAAIASPSGRTVHASAVTGAFHRYDAAPALTVSAPGYAAAEVTPADGPLEVALEPVTLAAGRLVPAVLTDAGPALALGAPDGPLVLTQPGRAPVVVAAERGVIALDPRALSPGAWTVETADGGVWPRALLVEDRGDVTFDGVTVDREADTLTVHAAPLEPGAAAWALWGVRRGLHPLPRLGASDAATFDLSSVPRDEGPVDLLVVDGSAVLAAADLWAAPGSPPADGLQGTSCTASGTAGLRWGPTGLGALALVGAGRKRRSR